jgi:hypothetical protein
MAVPSPDCGRRAAEQRDERTPPHVRHSALFPSRSGTGNNGSRSQLTTRSTCRRGAANLRKS